MLPQLWQGLSRLTGLRVSRYGLSSVCPRWKLSIHLLPNQPDFTSGGRWDCLPSKALCETTAYGRRPRQRNWAHVFHYRLTCLTDCIYGVELELQAPSTLGRCLVSKCSRYACKHFLMRFLPTGWRPGCQDRCGSAGHQEPVGAGRLPALHPVAVRGGRSCSRAVCGAHAPAGTLLPTLKEGLCSMAQLTLFSGHMRG